MNGQFLFDVFLSHNSEDKPKVRRLAERLKQAGLRVWLDEWNIKHGDMVTLKMDEGLEQSRVLLLCISPNALASGWVALERSTAIHRDPANEGRRFIPLLLADCDLPDTLRRYKYVDFRDDAEAAFMEVLTACRPEISEVRLTGPEKDARPAVVEKSSGKKLVPTKRASVERRGDTGPLAVLERQLTGHKDRVNCVAVSPDGHRVVSGSGDSDRIIRTDQSVKVWNLNTGECSATLEGHSDAVRSVAFTPDGKRILSASRDDSIRIWDANSSREILKLMGHTDIVWSVVALPGNTRSLSSSADGTLRMWNIVSGTCEKIIEGGDRSRDDGWCCAINPSGDLALAGAQNGEIRVWDLTSGERVATLEGHSNTVFSIKISPNGRFVVSGSGDNTVKIWDLNARKCLGTFEGHQSTVFSVAISPDGNLIASAGFTDGTVRLWDWKSGTCLQRIEQENGESPISVAFGPGGSRLVVGVSGPPHNIYVYRITRVRPEPSADATRRYVNAKVVLLGEGTVGKTSLAHRLIADQYVIPDRTHGMNVWRLELPLPRDATLEREALLWDLAGQEDYRLIHPLFLQETALALLLVNPQTADPFRETGDWLKMLKSAANEQDHKREADRLLVLSQVDVGGPKLSDAKLDQFCQENGFGKWLLTSAKTGRNCSDKENAGKASKLKRLIAECIPWDKLPWTSTPRLLAELKNAVAAMRDEQDIRLLRFAELTQRLEQALPDEAFGESDVRTAVTLLANHGLARPLKFGDLVLLQPELLNGYAAAIIRAAREHTDEIGCVLETDIYCEKFDFTGVERLKHRPDEELLLRALVQTFLDHSLCIAEDTPNGRHLVFPSQYRREKDIPHEPDIFVSYTFSGEWQTVWTTLVVRLWYSQEFQHRELWRNAAEFASPKGYTLGLKIDNRQGEGTAKISFYFDKDVGDELKSLFIEYGHRHLARYAAEVSRDRRYVCKECGKPVKDLDAVRRRKQSGKDFINCQECDDVKVPFVDFIEQRLQSDPVARKILAMDEVATRELDTQALEQILIGHMMAIAGEANQIFRPVAMFDHGIDGEVEFKDNDGKASGKRVYIQLKSGNSYLRARKSDGNEVFDVTNERHLDYWVNQPVDVYLVIRQTDDASGQQVIRWMNVTRYLKARKDKKSRQIIFVGEKLDMEAVWKVRDGFFPPKGHAL